MKTKEEIVNLGIDGFKADEIMKLQEKMLEQAVKFQYVKKDMSVRDAEGTLVRGDMVQEDGTVWEPKGPQKEEDSKSVFFKYFDLGAKAWRQFNMFSFIGLVEG